MNELLPHGARLEKLFSGTIWAEGPVWLPQSQTVRWSDIPNNRIMSFDARSRETTVHRTEVEFTNGRTLDQQGRVVQCSHGRRSVEYEIDGEISTLVDRFEGHRLNSPNDVVVASDGAIWFTDPPYGILPGTREGHDGDQEYGGCWVFRFDPETSELVPVIVNLVHPNGLAFSPDESLLYVSDTGPQPDGGEAPIWVFDVADNQCSNGRIFTTIDPPPSDGFRVDEAGRVWTSTGDSVQVYGPEAELLLKIDVPERVANVCFGGEDGHDLYITATTSLYRIKTNVRQAERP